MAYIITSLRYPQWLRIEKKCLTFPKLDVNLCFKGRYSLETLIISCMCYFHYYTCVEHGRSKVNSWSATSTTNDFIYLSVDGSVYSKTDYLAPDVKVFISMSSLASIPCSP